MAAVFWGVSPHSLVHKNQNTRSHTPQYSCINNHKNDSDTPLFRAECLRPPPHININFRVSKIAAQN
jgi:hypothetical protein